MYVSASPCHNRANVSLYCGLSVARPYGGFFVKKVVLLLTAATLALGYSVALSPVQAQAAKKKGAVVVNKVNRQAFRDRLFKGKVSPEVATAEQLLLDGKYAQAQDAFWKAVNKNSRDTNALTGLGFALTLQYKLDAADEQFDKALKVNPKTPLALVGQAMTKLNRLTSSNMTVISQRQGTLVQADALCRQALKYDSNLAEAYIVQGMVQKEQGNLQAARASLTKGINIDKNYASAYVQRGLIDLKMGDTASAVTDFGQAISLRTDMASAHYGLGKAYLQQGQTDEAYKSLNTALSLNKNSAPAHIAMGDTLFKQGNRNAAIKEYQEAIRIKAESDEAYLRMADIRESRGDLELALGDLRSGLALNGNSVDLHRRAGDISLRLEKTDDALKEYNHVLAINPSDTGAVNGMTRALVVKAQKDANGAYFLSNNFEQAEGLIQKAIQMNPNNMELRLADAKLRAMSGKPVDLSTVGNPTNDPQRIAYAEACLAQFKYQEARQAMDTVIGNTQTSQAAFAVADMALMIRDLDSAEAAYKKGGSFNDEDAAARSKRGLAQVASARGKAQQQLTLASDLAKKKQYPSAIDKYRDAAYQNPRLAQAHMGLAEALEKLWKNQAPAMREAALHYRAYASLTPGMPEKEQEKIAKKADKCDEIAYKIEQGKPPSKLSSLFAPVEAFGSKVGSGFKKLVQ